MYIAPTLEDARRLMWDRIKNRFQSVIAKSNDTRLELIIPTQDRGTSIIFLGSWEKVNNYRGDEFDFVVFDEVQDYRNFWTGWHEAMRPTLTPRLGTALFMGTPKGFTHFFDLYNTQTTDKNFKSFHFTSYDNPHLAVEEIDEARRQMTEDRFAQEYLADFRKTEGLVYKEFSREKHLFDNEKAIVSTIKFAGVDFGFTNPCAVLTIKEDYDKTYWITDEYYKTGKTDSEVAEVVAGSAFNEVYPDPENPAAIEELKRRGVNIKDVLKGKDSVKNGISKVRDLFKQNRIKIHSRCVNLISELETYSYPDKKDMHNEDELPIKEHDHAVDSLRYALMMREDRNTSRKATVFMPSVTAYGQVPKKPL
jgi:PBSX family phage terminase large subunit